METSNKVKKSPSLLWLWITIPTISILTIVAFFFSSDYQTLCTLHFYAGLRESNYLKEIDGKPEKIKLEDYNHEEIMNLCNGRGLIFPFNISLGNVSMFTFHEIVHKESGYNVDRYELFLEWEMDTSFFNQETERLSKIELTRYSKTKNALYSKNLFSLPSYITSYNYTSCFEYAIMEEKTNTIRYVCFTEVGSKDYLVFPSEYVPTKPLIKSDLKNTIGSVLSYSIY